MNGWPKWQIGVLMEDRRKNRRLEMESKLVIKRLDQPGASEDAYIEIVDVSKTGVGFMCSNILSIGAVYEAYLRIWTQEVIHAFIEIVRIEKKGDSYEYGGIFVGMPEMEAQRIGVYETINSLQE